MKRQSGMGAIASIILVCVFGTALFFGLVSGARVYRNVADRTEEDAGERIGLSYISAKIHAGDADGMVRVGTFGEGDAVFLLEEIGGTSYETVLYVYGGQLREMLCEEGHESDPESGQPITEARSFRASSEKGLIHMEYEDAGGKAHETDVYVRSGR